MSDAPEWKCPLGDDCDLTVAWMAGYEDAKGAIRVTKVALEIERAKLAKARELIALLEADQARSDLCDPLSDPRVSALVSALEDAVEAWETHQESGDIMQGYWLHDARSALAALRAVKEAGR